MNLADKFISDSSNLLSKYGFLLTQKIYDDVDRYFSLEFSSGSISVIISGEFSYTTKSITEISYRNKISSYSISIYDIPYLLESDNPEYQYRILYRNLLFVIEHPTFFMNYENTVFLKYFGKDILWK